MAETVTAVLRLVAGLLASALRPSADLLGSVARSLSEIAPAPHPEAGALVIAVAVVATLAAALYLATTVAWTLVQRLVLRRVYPLATA